MSKPDMIRKLEQGEELWTTERIFPSQSYLGESVQIKSVQWTQEVDTFECF